MYRMLGKQTQRAMRQGWKLVSVQASSCSPAARDELLQGLCAALYLLFPSHDPSAGLAALGGSKPLHRAIRALRAVPAALCCGHVPAVTMALLQHSPYLVTLGDAYTPLHLHLLNVESNPCVIATDLS